MSNLHSHRDFGDDDARAAGSRLGGPVLRKVERREVHAALRLILGSGGRLANEEQVVDFLRFAMYRGIDLNDAWVAADDDGRDGKILWAILPIVSPGRTMLLFAPSIIPDTIRDTSACPLVERVLAHFQGRAVDLAQVLIDPAEKPAVELFRSCAFQHLAELIYLDRAVRRAPAPALPPGFSWETYSAASHPSFATTVSATYERSLDCPNLNGVRHIEDVLAGHKAAGEFDASLWFLLREHGRPVGVLLLNRAPRTEALELVYLGLVPAARRRGLADVMMRQALATAATIGSRRLSLAVDSINAPALKLYRRHGMSRVCSRLAMIRDLRPARATLPATQPQ